MKSINFSQNWAGKLDLDEFTTIRLYRPNHYHVGDKILITMGKKGAKLDRVCTAHITNVAIVRIYDLTETISMRDIGKPLSHLIELLQSMYRWQGIDWNTQELLIYTLKVHHRLKWKQLSMF